MLMIKSCTLISAAAVLISCVLASPVESTLNAHQSRSSCKSVESHLESIDTFPDAVGVLGDTKLLIDHSDSILKDMNKRLTRIGVDKHTIRHRSLFRRQQPDNTGKLVPIAKLAEKIQNSINALTKIILELECPSSLPMEDFIDCIAAQDDPLRRLREWYPDSLDWDATEDQGPSGAAATYGCGTPAPRNASSMSISASMAMAMSSADSGPSTTSNPAPGSTLSLGSVSSSGAVNTSASVTTSQSVATSTIDTTSTYTTTATVTVNPSQTVTFTLTAETTIATTVTATVDVTSTIDVTTTINVASVIYPPTSTSTSTTSTSALTTTSCTSCGSVTSITSYRTVYLHTTTPPYLYPTVTSIVMTS